jgi:hypothetical protein
MSAGESEPPLESEPKGREGLLFTGEAIRRLTPEQIATIGKFADQMYGVEMRAVPSARQLGELSIAVVRGERAPVPATQKDFRDFAAAHGFTDSIARRSWKWFELLINPRELSGKQGRAERRIVTLTIFGKLFVQTREIVEHKLNEPFGPLVDAELRRRAVEEEPAEDGLETSQRTSLPTGGGSTHGLGWERTTWWRSRASRTIQWAPWGCLLGQPGVG